MDQPQTGIGDDDASRTVGPDGDASPQPPAPPVRRRKVFYLPGYDPIPPRRYRELYRREGVKQAAISGYGIEVVESHDVTRTAFGWGVTGEADGTVTEADIEVLAWSEVVVASMGHSILATYLQLARTAWIYFGSGALPRMMTLRRGPAMTAMFPVGVLLGQLLVAILLVWAGWAVLGRLVHPLAGLAMGGLAAWALLKGIKRLDGRLFVYYLMHDYAFTAHLRGEYPEVLEAQLAAFTDRLAAATAEDWDEVLVIGHSSGAYLAVSVMADLLRRGQPARMPALLTLGQVVPMASFLPRAWRLRADLRDLAARAELTWIDVSAPGDPCCFGLSDPVAVTGVAPVPQHNPLVLSASFRQTLSPETQARLRGRWFRLHFQYLCAFDRPRDYDYFGITAGPVALRDRFAGRSHSPGRITRANNRYRSTGPAP